MLNVAFTMTRQGGETNHSLWSRFEPRFVTARFHQKEVNWRNIPDSSFRYGGGQLPGDGQWKRWEACRRGI
jgi:hypothetical protein